MCGPEGGGSSVGASCGAAPEAGVLDGAAGGADAAAPLAVVPISGGRDAGAAADAAADAGACDAEAAEPAEAGTASEAGAGSEAGAAGFTARGVRCAGACVCGFEPDSQAIHARSLSRNTSKVLGCTSVSKRTRASITRARSAR